MLPTELPNQLSLIVRNIETIKTDGIDKTEVMNAPKNTGQPDRRRVIFTSETTPTTARMLLPMPMMEYSDESGSRATKRKRVKMGQRTVTAISPW